MHGSKIVYNITVISLALHVCDVTSYDNTCSTNYCVRSMCEKLCQKKIGIFDLLYCLYYSRYICPCFCRRGETQTVVFLEVHDPFTVYL